jgi:hypothetical protein
MYEAFLRGVPLFSTLTTGELLTVADALQPVRVSEDTAESGVGGRH